MKRFATPDGLLALIALVLAVIALAIWLPNDIETGLIEKVRRQVRIGDAALPALGLAIIILGALLTVFAQQAQAPSLSRANLAYLAKLAALLLASLLLMRWAGPLVTDALGAGDYRALRDTVPWKYIGFMLGGTLLVAGLMALMERRLTTRAILIGLVASAALIAVYDLPFEDLLLPPNGDV